MPKDFIKYIQRLPKKERERLFQTIEMIALLQLDRLDIKKMQWFKNRYRARIGDFRIVFEIENNTGIIYDVNNRGDIY